MDNIQFTLHTPSYSVGQTRLLNEVLRFGESVSGKNVYAFNFSRRTDISLIALTDIIVRAFQELRRPSIVQFCDGGNLVIKSADLLVAVIDLPNGDGDPRRARDRTITVNGYGDVDILLAQDRIKSAIPEMHVPSLSWEFETTNGRRSQDVQIDAAKPIHREFYPWLGCDAYEYIDRYMASESSILVLLGEPGTAKTSLIRSMIWHTKTNAMITYEEGLLQTDGMFVEFMTNPQVNLLVIEDADLLLTSREHDGNKIMSKFLNISDGLVKLGNKKIVFTANVLDAKKIDSALLRPGRCFDCLTFRRLTFAEACAAASVAGLPKPQQERSYTIAELFAEARGDRAQYTQKRIGFTA